MEATGIAWARKCAFLGIKNAFGSFGYFFVLLINNDYIERWFRHRSNNMKKGILFCLSHDFLLLG